MDYIPVVDDSKLDKFFIGTDGDPVPSKSYFRELELENVDSCPKFGCLSSLLHCMSCRATSHTM